jgi:PhnB protein
VETRITPFLTVRDAASAIAFYERAFGAREVERFTAPSGQIVAELSIDGAQFFVVDENPEAFNLSPDSLGGTSVRIDLFVDDPDGTAEQAVAAGAEILFPVADQPYGLRQGRVQDPFGHHWLVSKPLSE